MEHVRALMVEGNVLDSTGLHLDSDEFEQTYCERKFITEMFIQRCCMQLTQCHCCSCCNNRPLTCEVFGVDLQLSQFYRRNFLASLLVHS